MKHIVTVALIFVLLACGALMKITSPRRHRGDPLELRVPGVVAATDGEPIAYTVDGERLARPRLHPRLDVRPELLVGTGRAVQRGPPGRNHRPSRSRRFGDDSGRLGHGGTRRRRPVGRRAPRSLRGHHDRPLHGRSGRPRDSQVDARPGDRRHRCRRPPRLQLSLRAGRIRGHGCGL